MNVTARLASEAGRGAVLVTTDAAAAAGLDPHLPRRHLRLKGRREPMEVVDLFFGAGFVTERPVP